MNNLDSWGWVAFVMLGLAWIGEAIHRVRSWSSVESGRMARIEPPEPWPSPELLSECWCGGPHWCDMNCHLTTVIRDQSGRAIKIEELCRSKKVKRVMSLVPQPPNPDEPWIPDCYVTRRYGPQDFDTDGADWVGK